MDDVMNNRLGMIYWNQEFLLYGSAGGTQSGGGGKMDHEGNSGVW